MWCFQTLLRFCLTPKSSHPNTTKKMKTEKKYRKKKHWVHLALVHVKNANNNLCESPLTSLVIVTRSICIHVKNSKLLAVQKRVRSWSRRCQRSNQGKSITQPPAPLFNHEEAHLTWLSGYKSTNKPLENCLPWRVVDVMLVERKKEKTRGKTVKPSKKNEKLTCSLLMALSSMCTILVFTKVLRSFVCFNTFQGFVFSGWRRYEFLSHVIKHPRTASSHYMSSIRHLMFLGGPVH